MDYTQIPARATGGWAIRAAGGVVGLALLCGGCTAASADSSTAGKHPAAATAKATVIPVARPKASPSSKPVGATPTPVPSGRSTSYPTPVPVPTDPATRYKTPVPVPSVSPLCGVKPVSTASPVPIPSPTACARTTPVAEPTAVPKAVPSATR
jgi:hypothetical protein